MKRIFAAQMEQQRYFLEIVYKGTVYHGWQIQPNALTVQELLNKALSIVFRQPIETIGCGRTDTGVHARQFFVHFDLDSKIKIPYEKYLSGLNALLPEDIAVKRLIPVPPEAHARFDAIRRTYEYHIHFSKDPFKTDTSWLWKDPLNIVAMNEAAEILKQYDYFDAFCKVGAASHTTICKISHARWAQEPDGLVFTISADRFLRNMVRAIVGTMIEIGKGTLVAADMRKIIESRDRSRAGTSVPACGLFLTEVKYPYINSE